MGNDILPRKIQTLLDWLPRNFESLGAREAFKRTAQVLMSEPGMAVDTPKALAVGFASPDDMHDDFDFSDMLRVSSDVGH